MQAILLTSLDSSYIFDIEILHLDPGRAGCTGNQARTSLDRKALSMSINASLPVAIIGAGPVGLAAAAQLATRNTPFVVLESGAEAGSAIREWGHVRLFSPWQYNVDSAARCLLEDSGWREPDPNAYPTGKELVDGYLAPLAATDRLAPHVRYDQRVTAISRDIVDKMKDTDRADRPFVLQTITSNGDEDDVHARAVIDASGTWTEPNPIGANGLHVPGERALSDVIAYGIPDVLDTARDRYEGKRVMVLGSGHSAFNALADLATLANEAPETRIFWAIRRSSPGNLFGGGDDDSLPERGALGTRIRDLANAGVVTQLTNVHIIRLRRTGDGIDDRSERTLLRHGPPARVSGAQPRRTGLLRCGHEELWSRADLPHAHRLRAGQVDRQRPHGGF